MTFRHAADARHPSVRHFAPFFDYTHLPPELASVSCEFEGLAEYLVITLPDGPELAVALRKLLESKDAAVRAAVAKREADNSGPRVVRCPQRGGHLGHSWHLGSPDGSLYQIPPADAESVWCRGEENR